MHSCHSMSAIVLFNQQKIRDRHKREALVEAFHRADKNGDGKLSVDEVLGIYVEHGVDVTREEASGTMHSEMSESEVMLFFVSRQVQRIFDAADKDGTGLLTEKEFVNSSKPGEVAGVSDSHYESFPNSCCYCMYGMGAYYCCVYDTAWILAFY